MEKSLPGAGGIRLTQNVNAAMQVKGNRKEMDAGRVAFESCVDHF